MPHEPPKKPAPQNEGDNFLSSSMARGAKHFGGADGDQDDRIEVWGRRIGRGLSAVGFVVLSWLLGKQLGWW